MLGLTLLMVAAAVAVGFIASRVSAAIGRDLRREVFSTVVGYSNAEIEKFSTASLITRTTNDIQQVQFVCVILLRMVAYAPIWVLAAFCTWQRAIPVFPGSSLWRWLHCWCLSPS